MVIKYVVSLVEINLFNVIVFILSGKGVKSVAKYMYVSRLCSNSKLAHFGNKFPHIKSSVYNGCYF